MRDECKYKDAKDWQAIDSMFSDSLLHRYVERTIIFKRLGMGARATIEAQGKAKGDVMPEETEESLWLLND